MNLQAIQNKVQPIANKMSNNRYLKAIMNGMMSALPATIIGSFAALINQFPIPAWQTFLADTGISNYLQLPVIFTTNFLAVIFVVSITYGLVESFDKKGITASIIALVSFMVITPVEILPADFGISVNIPMTWLGSTGIFTAIIVAMIVGCGYVWITDKGWTIKMPDSVPPFIKDSFAGLIPGVLLVTFFIVVAAIFGNTSFGSFHQMVYSLLQTPLQSLGGNIWALLLVSVLSQLLWFFGIHGSLVALTVMMPIWLALDAQQLAAYSAGQPLPNIVGYNFFVTFTYAGTQLGLATLMLVAKSQRYKTLGKLSAVPSYFGITEPVIFGTPLVFNPLFAIPFVLGPSISLVLAYIATIVGIIPRMTGVGAPTGTPYILQGFMTGGWRVAAFQAVLFIVYLAMWYPFFKIADNKALAEEQA